MEGIIRKNNPMKKVEYCYKYNEKFDNSYIGKVVAVLNIATILIFAFMGVNDIFIGFMIVCFIVLDVYLYQKWENKNGEMWRFRRKIQCKIDYFLITNNFILSHDEKSGEGENVVKIKVFDYIPSIYYKRKGKHLIISFVLDGSAISDKFYNLEQRLSNLFNLDVEDIRENNGKLQYIFSLSKDIRLKVKNESDFKNFISNRGIQITGSLFWNYQKNPHALVTGGTGSGKTFFLLYLIKTFLSANSNVKVIDPKRSDLSQFDSLLGEKNVAFSVGNIAKMLREVSEEMNKRYDEMRSNVNYEFGKDFSDYGYKPIVIFFDELMAFMGSADSKVSKEVMKYLVDIVAKGRQAGCFMVLTMQRADSEYLKASVRDQLGMRVTLGNMSSDGYGMVFGNQCRNLSLKNYNKGDGFIYIDGVMNKPRQFSSPFIDIKKINL